jgi:hypothetical protein
MKPAEKVHEVLIYLSCAATLQHWGLLGFWGW